MEIDDALIDKLESLAKLKLSQDERNVLKEDISQMVGMFDKIGELDTEGVEPLIHMTNAENNMREDVPNNAFSHEEAIKNAPNPIGRYFSVPKVIE